MKRFFIPGIIILFGAGWLLADLDVVRLDRLVWTLSLLASGAAIFAVRGFNSASFVLGSLLIIGAGLSLLRYGGMLTIAHEIPILVIIFGVLLAINQTRLIPRAE